MRRIRPIVARTPEALAEVIGVSAAEAREWEVRYALLKHLKEIVRRKKITHAAIAQRARTSRTRITAILNDNIENVSSDLLIRILGALGYSVTITVSKANTAA